MLNIVLPMAGKGSRFANAGYSLPKPFIDVAGKPMIKVVIDNLRPKIEHRFIFICQNDHIKRYNAKALLESYTDDPIIIGIDGYTEGQLCTALLAEKFINSDDMLMTANTDQYIDFDINQFLEELQTKKLDGLIMTMTAHDPKWSYAKINTATGLVEETAEKIVISDQATCGIYSFKNGKDFVKAGKKLIANDFRTNGEFYICPCYNELIKVKKKIGVFNIGKEGNGMYGLGIPSDLKYFLSLDISKKLRG